MSHFAKVENGIVTNVIVIEQDVLNSGAWGDPSSWIQTSYNTKAGVHLSGGTPLRGNYAGIGYTYDSVNDVFYAPRPTDRNDLPCDSWTIGAPSWTWVAPTAPPTTTDKIYAWDEPTKAWVDITPTPSANTANTAG
jgi:hypothetical protein